MLTGGCLCGGVRYEISEPLVSSGYCHCTRCQRRTGAAASAQARIVPGSLTVLHGEDLVRAWEPPGGGYAKEFCSRCGSALWSRHPDDPEVIAVRLGTFDDDPGIRPSFHNFAADAPAWLPVPEDGVERYDAAKPVRR